MNNSLAACSAASLICSSQSFLCFFLCTFLHTALQYFTCLHLLHVLLTLPSLLRGDSFALTYVGESTRYGVVEDVLDHEVSEYMNENKKF